MIATPPVRNPVVDSRQQPEQRLREYGEQTVVDGQLEVLGRFAELVLELRANEELRGVLKPPSRRDVLERADRRQDILATTRFGIVLRFLVRRRHDRSEEMVLNAGKPAFGHRLRHGLVLEIFEIEGLVCSPVIQDRPHEGIGINRSERAPERPVHTSHSRVGNALPSVIAAVLKHNVETDTICAAPESVDFARADRSFRDPIQGDDELVA